MCIITAACCNGPISFRTDILHWKVRSFNQATIFRRVIGLIIPVQVFSPAADPSISS